MNIDKQAAIEAAAITVLFAGLIALFCWSIADGPDWIWQAILIAGALAVIFYAAYALISTR